MSSEEQRRHSEAKVYTQDDIDVARRDARNDERDRQRDQVISELKGSIQAMPATFEAVARRVFSDMMRANREENSNQRWRRADTLIIGAQAMLAAAAVAAGLIASGKI